MYLKLKGSEDYLEHFDLSFYSDLLMKWTELLYILVRKYSLKLNLYTNGFRASLGMMSQLTFYFMYRFYFCF